LPAAGLVASFFSVSAYPPGVKVSVRSVRPRIAPHRYFAPETRSLTPRTAHRQRQLLGIERDRMEFPFPHTDRVVDRVARWQVLRLPAPSEFT
jgi:hypothetical protein